MNEQTNETVVVQPSLLSSINTEAEPHFNDESIPDIDESPKNLSQIENKLSEEEGDIPNFEVPQDSGAMPLYLQEAIEQGLSKESAQVILDHVNSQKLNEEQAKFVTKTATQHSLDPTNVRIVSAAVIGGAPQNEIQDMLNKFNNQSPQHSKSSPRERDDQIFPESVADREGGNYGRVGMFGAFGSFFKSVLQKKEVDANAQFQKDLAAFNEREKSIGELISEIANSSIATTAKKLAAQGLPEDKIKDALADFPIDEATKKNGDKLVEELAELEKFSVKLSAGSKNADELESNQDLVLGALEKMKSKITNDLPGIDLSKINKKLSSIFDEISERINRVFKALFNRMGFNSESKSELSLT